MRLFHGSNVAVIKPKFFHNARALDFGEGFYLTTSLEQASKWARLTLRRRNVGAAIVSAFEIDEADFASLAVLRFEKPDASWLKFVSYNRKTYKRQMAYGT